MRNSVWILVTLALASTVVYLGAQPVTGPQIPDSEIATVAKQIDEAEAESAKLAGGLIKATIELRIATLRQTQAMLQQRQKAFLNGIALRYVVEGQTLKVPSDSAQQVAFIDSELATLDAKIEAQRTEAARYSGGLVQALSLSTLATMQQTRAMLDQKQLSLKYGLPQFIGFADQLVKPASGAPAATVPAAPRSATPVAATPSLPESREWQIVSVSSRVTEQNDSWWKHAWRLTLKNNSTLAMAFDATIEFQDADGFAIDDDRERNLVVQAGQEQTFTGYALVTVPGGSRVARTNAKVQPAR